MAAAGLWLAIRTHRPVTLSVYFGFVLLASIAGLPLLRHTGTNAYRLAYFSVEITHTLILVALAVNLLAHLVSDRLAVFWSVFWISLALVGIFHKRHEHDNSRAAGYLHRLTVLRLGLASGVGVSSKCKMDALRSSVRLRNSADSSGCSAAASSLAAIGGTNNNRFSTLRPCRAWGSGSSLRNSQQ
jgi:hypothetical protein